MMHGACHGQGHVDVPIEEVRHHESEKHSGAPVFAWVDASSYKYMDHHRRTAEDEQRQQQQIRARSQTRSPRQWQEVPVSYRPREWHDYSEEVLPARTLTPSQNVPPFRQFQRQLGQPIQPLRPWKRPVALASTPSLQQYEAHASHINPALLYPQLSPYDGETTSTVLLDEPRQHLRSVSQPNTPSFMAIRTHSEEPDEYSLIAPAFPPSRITPPRSLAATTEAPFTDDEEFHLFVQATAGLGPEQHLRDSPTTVPSSDHQGPRRDTMQYSNNHNNRQHQQQQWDPPSSLVSPIHTEQTPTTLRALQHLAQMPQQQAPTSTTTFTLPRRPTPHRVVTDPIHASDGGLDLWMEPPSADHEDAVSPLEEDELPGYAESQAQAQAVQAEGARRRAQELARRWQQAHE